MNVHMYGIGLVSVNLQSAFAHDTQASPQASWCGWAISYNSRSYLVFLQGKINSALYIAQVVNAVLLPFLWQEGDVLFQQDNTHPHRVLWCNVLFVVYNKCPSHPGQQDLQISCQLNKYGTRWARTYSVSRAWHYYYLIATIGAWCLGNLSHDAFCIFMTVFMQVYTPALPPEGRGVHCVLMWLCVHPLLWHMCFIWSEFVIIYSYNDKLPVRSIFNTMNLSRRGFRGGARGPGPPLSDHTTIIEFSGTVLKYFLHTFSISSNIMLLFINIFFTFFHCPVSFCNIDNCKIVNFLYNLLRSIWWY